jgi:3-oxoadipate CoA-transferase beta subunit
MSDTKPAAEKIGLSRLQIAWRAAQDIADGSYVNLGIGMPMTIPRFCPKAARSCCTAKTDFWAWGRRRPRATKTGT